MKTLGVLKCKEIRDLVNKSRITVINKQFIYKHNVTLIMHTLMDRTQTPMIILGQTLQLSTTST